MLEIDVDKVTECVEAITSAGDKLAKKGMPEIAFVAALQWLIDRYAEKGMSAVVVEKGKVN